MTGTSPGSTILTRNRQLSLTWTQFLQPRPTYIVAFGYMVVCHIRLQEVYRSSCYNSASGHLFNALIIIDFASSLPPLRFLFVGAMFCKFLTPFMQQLCNLLSMCLAEHI